MNESNAWEYFLSFDEYRRHHEAEIELELVELHHQRLAEEHWEKTADKSRKKFQKAVDDFYGVRRNSKTDTTAGAKLLGLPNVCPLPGNEGVAAAARKSVAKRAKQTESQEGPPSLRGRIAWTQYMPKHAIAAGAPDRPVATIRAQAMLSSSEKPNLFPWVRMHAESLLLENPWLWVSSVKTFQENVAGGGGKSGKGGDEKLAAFHDAIRKDVLDFVRTLGLREPKREEFGDGYGWKVVQVRRTFCDFVYRVVMSYHAVGSRLVML